MLRTILYLLVAVVISTACSCKKDSHHTDESVLYGLWVKGSQTGDTLQFFRQNDKNWLRYALSFNPLIPVSTESEYRYSNGKLEVKNYLSAGNFFPLQSFTWKRAGKEFEIRGSELYPFISSTNVSYRFTKVD